MGLLKLPLAFVLSVTSLLAQYSSPNGGSSGGSTGLIFGQAALFAPYMSSGGASWVALPYTCGNQVVGLSNTATCTWSTNPSPGASIFCYVQNYSTVPTFSVADSASNSYSPLGTVFYSGPGGLEYMQLFYFSNISSSISSVTVTVTSSNGMYPGIGCNGATGIVAGNDGTSTGNSTLDMAPPYHFYAGTLTTTAADYVFCGAVLAEGGTPLGVLSPFTEGSVTAYPNSINQYYVQPSAGSITPVITVPTAVPTTGLLCGAWKP